MSMRGLWRCTVLLPLMLLPVLPVSAQPARLHPVDEAAQNPSFLVFRQRLMEALRVRDVAFINGILDPGIKVSFGGDEGPRDFVKYWDLDHPESSRIWNEFQTLLALGGAWQRDGGPARFCAPYVFTHFPSGYDAFEYSAITGRGVAVRERPDPSAPVIARLSFDIVRSEYAEPAAAWTRITTPSGRSGYVARRYIRSPIDYRACFRRGANGDWKLDLLVAGD